MNTMMNRLRIVSIIALAFPALALSGCTAIVAGGGAFAAHQAMQEDSPNLAAQNYAVADYLIQQADTYVKHGSLIVVEPLTDIQTPEFSTTIARLIPEQIGIRLSQLGYRVDLAQVTTSADTNYLRPALKPDEKADFILSGSYLRRRSAIDVKMRMIDVNRGQIVAVFDYPIAADSEIRKLSEPKAKITRVEQGI